MIDALITCLALNIYYEARNQPIDGQVAVAHVVLTRVADPRFPNDPCKVIKEGPVRNGLPVINRCQFSWYCDGRSDTPKDTDAYRWAVYLATVVAEGKYDDPTGGATHYHADHISPGWSFAGNPVATIGNHIFYRWGAKTRSALEKEVKR